MNTADLIERVAAEHGVAKDQARKIIESALAAITAGAIGRGSRTGRLWPLQGRRPARTSGTQSHHRRAHHHRRVEEALLTPAKALRYALNQRPTKTTAKAA